jgi:sugar O-acyltransferase (sialic acid O-acetyltransferase NeuD family)
MTSPAFQAGVPIRPLVLLGAGGHARVLLALARAAGHSVLGVCDPQLAADGDPQWEGVDVLGDDAALERYRPGEVHLMLGVGQLTDGTLRERLYRTLRDRGYTFPVLIHPTAWLAPDVSLAAGVQVMAGVVVQPGCQVGENSVLNTRVSIDHDCWIGSDVHVAPGATLCGSVTAGSGAYIGAGAVVIQGIRIGERAVVGAGVTLVRDLEPALTILGAANRIRSRPGATAPSGQAKVSLQTLRSEVRK